MPRAAPVSNSWTWMLPTSTSLRTGRTACPGHTRKAKGRRRPSCVPGSPPALQNIQLSKNHLWSLSISGEFLTLVLHNLPWSAPTSLISLQLSVSAWISIWSAKISVSECGCFGSCFVFLSCPLWLRTYSFGGWETAPQNMMALNSAKGWGPDVDARSVSRIL